MITFANLPNADGTPDLQGRAHPYFPLPPAGRPSRFAEGRDGDAQPVAAAAKHDNRANATHHPGQRSAARRGPGARARMAGPRIAFGPGPRPGTGVRGGVVRRGTPHSPTKHHIRRNILPDRSTTATSGAKTATSPRRIATNRNISQQENKRRRRAGRRGSLWWIGWGAGGGRRFRVRPGRTAPGP